MADTTETPDWEPGNLVQINPHADSTFGGSFMVVQEVRSWGATGYITLPGKGIAPYRVEYKDAELVGIALWIAEHKPPVNEDPN